ncbi:hypothetical protein MishRS11D_13020 [Methylomagnum ishizawai]|nr:hypothetical protein MishRS11D_13020 [Methylomagnum ishizawai]
MGPTAQLFVNAFATAKLWGDGHPWRAVEKIMPLKAVADLMKAYRYAGEGATTLNGDELVEEVNAAEVFATALGFPPMRISERYAENQGFVNASKALHERRQEIMDQVAQGRMKDDGEALDRGVAEARAFTAKHPDMAISGRDLAQSVRARLRRRALTADGLYVPPKERELRDKFRFGATE